MIGFVLIPGRKAPKLVTEEMVKSMEPGSVIVDAAIDQGGNFETINYPTSHDEPVVVRHDVLHYAVPNIPGIGTANYNCWIIECDCSICDTNCAKRDRKGHYLKARRSAQV